MTIDSAYYIEQYLPDDDVTYIFQMESIGSEAIEVWTTDMLCGGIRGKMIEGVDYTLVLDKYRKPIHKNGKIILNEPLDPNLFLSIERKTPIIFSGHFVAFDEFNTEQFEYALDKICFIEQEIEGGACDCRGVELPWPPPPSGEISVCKVYECDAYTTRASLILSGSGGSFWPLQDAIDANITVDTASGRDLDWWGTPNMQTPTSSWGIDQCGGQGEDVGCSIGSAEASRDTTADWANVTSGTLGITFDPVATDSVGMLTISWDGAGGNDHLDLDFGGGSTIQLTMTASQHPDDGGGPLPDAILSWSGVVNASGETNILVNWSLDTSIGKLTAELFKGSVSYGVETADMGGRIRDLVNAQFKIGGAGGTGVVVGKYAIFNGTQITTAQLLDLDDAWNQNHTGYVDPNPDCIPMGG